MKPAPHRIHGRFGTPAALAGRLALIGCLFGVASGAMAQEAARPANPHAPPAPDPALLENPVTGPTPPRPAEVHALAVPASATRLDMALAFLRFERALQAASPSGEALGRVNDEFDDATFKFFRGEADRAVEALDDATLRLRGWGASDAAQAARRLRLRVSPAVWTYYSGPAPSVGVLALEEDSGAAKSSAGLSVSIEPVSGRGAEANSGGHDGDAAAAPRAVGARVSMPVAGAAGAEGLVDLSSFVRSLPPGRYSVDIVGDGGFRWEAGWWSVVSAPRAGVRSALLERLSAAQAGHKGEGRLRDAFRQARERVALLTDTPSEKNAAEIMIDQGELESEVSLEVRSLIEGADPYERRPGLIYGSFVSGTGDAEVSVPMWIYAPKSVCEERALPALVVVLHGAGADESMFMFGYGRGLIRDLADEKGFIVASPRAYAMTANPGVFDDLLTAMKARYGVDPSRVYVVGHSMGAIAASGLAQARAESITAVAAIAGLRLFDAKRASAPVLAYAAERDRIIPAARVKANAEAGAKAGLAVEYREAKGQGHTLVVGAVLRECVDWMLGVTRRSASTPREDRDRP